MSTCKFPLPCGRSTIVDTADLHLLIGYNWHADKRPHTVYVRGRLPGQHKGGVYLHFLIVGGRADHKDGDGLNNSRSNIRPCTQKQNTWNKAVKKGKPFKGVYLRGNSYWTQIYADGKSYYSGGHKSAEAAALAYDVLALQLHGDFARLNFPRPAP